MRQPVSRLSDGTPSLSLGVVSVSIASITLLGVLFITAVVLFLANAAPRLDLLRATFAPGSQADYAFSLDKPVAPQRASITRSGE